MERRQFFVRKAKSSSLTAVSIVKCLMVFPEPSVANDSPTFFASVTFQFMGTLPSDSSQ